MPVHRFRCSLFRILGADPYFLSGKQKTCPSFLITAGTGSIFFPAVPPGLIGYAFYVAGPLYAYRHMLVVLDGEHRPGADTCDTSLSPCPRKSIQNSFFVLHSHQRQLSVWKEVCFYSLFLYGLRRLYHKYRGRCQVIFIWIFSLREKHSSGNALFPETHGEAPPHYEDLSVISGLCMRKSN